MNARSLRSSLTPVALTLALASSPWAQAGSVDSYQKWSGLAGTLPTSPSAGDAYASGLESIGDLDGDGIGDVAVGLGGSIAIGGTVWIQFLNADGTVRAVQPITTGVGGFSGQLDAYDRFGRSIANLGDLDGDGVTDIAVSAHGDDDGGDARGAVYVLFLNVDGTVKAEQKISSTQGDFVGALSDDNWFGEGLTAPGDLDGDGVFDLIASSPRDDDGGVNRGALYVLFLETDGTVRNHVKISSTVGAFLGQLDDHDRFGEDALAFLGDEDGDGFPAIAVGTGGDDDGGTNRGAVWILELFPSGLVASFTKISATSGGFTGTLADTDAFGSSVAPLDDFDGDGVGDLLVGAYADSGNGGVSRGSIWILYMNADGTVRGHEEIGEGAIGFPADLDDLDYFGVDVTVIDDLDGNGVKEVVVGAFYDDDDGVDAGAAYVLYLEPCAVPASATSRNAGTNPDSYVADAPVLGEPWTGTVDLSTTGHAFAAVFGFDTAFQFTLSGGQTLLVVDGFGSGELLGLPLQAGPTATFQVDVPLITTLCGMTVATQAAHVGGVTPFALSNAQDLVLGT